MKPNNWKKKLAGDNHVSQANTIDSGFKSSWGRQLFTKEQIEQIFKILQSSFPNSNPSCSLVQKGNHIVASCFSVSSIHSWIINSGATDHMTWSSKLFSSYIPCAGNQRVKIVDGSFPIVISLVLTLHNVLHVPKLSCNLLSISKLTADQNC